MRIPVLTIIFLFIFSFLIDIYISVDVKNRGGKKGVSIYAATALLCYALLIVAISLPRRDADSGIMTVMWLLFTFLSIYAGKLFYVVCSLLGKIWCGIFKEKKGMIYFQSFGIALGMVIIGIMWIGVGYTRHHIEVTREEFYSKRLPQAFEGYKIVQLSDIHLGTWGNDTTFISNMVDTVNSLNPDLIVFTGDLVNRLSSEAKPFINVLSRLKAKDGVYSVLGNHDYGDYVDWADISSKKKNLQQLKDFQKQMGWKMLNNENVYLHRDSDSVLLIGVENWGEPPFPQYGDMKKAMEGNQRDGDLKSGNTFKLLLSHNPEHWNREVSEETNIDLTLAGHTHAMQGMIKIGDWKWSPAKYRYEQWGGRYDRPNENGENTSIYVNIGSGEVGMPSRLLAAYPEVTLITLKKK